MFVGCTSLTSINLDSWTTTNITTSYRTFYGCSALTSINISGWNMASVTTTESMFQECTSLTSITFPDSLTLISSNTCYGCSVLATINIGTGVTSIATLAFNLGGTAGRSITYNFYRSTAPTISGTPFPNFNTADNVHLHVPSGSSSYNTAPWTTDAIFDQPISFDL
jgi:surface protein